MAKTCANCIYKDRKWGDNPCRTCMESGSDNHENWTGIDDEEEAELKGDKWQKLKDFLTEGKHNISKDVCVSRPSVFEEILDIMEELEKRELPELILCKDCKYFEYDSVAQVDGIPLIVAHEICKKWGEGCKTNENGYCFLAEPKRRE